MRKIKEKESLNTKKELNKVKKKILNTFKSSGKNKKITGNT